MTISAPTEQLIAACLPFWKASFITSNGSVWKKSNTGRKAGKALPETQIAAALRDNVALYRNAPTGVQLDVLNNLIAMDTADDTGEGAESAIEEVDPWIVPLLMCFRWRSDGASVRGFFHRRLAQHLAEGGDPDDQSIIREVLPMDTKDENCVAIALMANPDIWIAFERVYKQAIDDPFTRVTPKSVKEGVRFYHSFRGYLRVQTVAWLSDIRFHLPHEPLTVANAPEKWGFWHFGRHTHPEVMQTPGPTPAWDGWLAKLGHPDRARAFRAWVFSVFFAKNKSRQIMWLEGRGGDGKGAVAYAISAFMGDRGVTPIDDNTFTGEFGMASVYGHRLLIHPDCKNARLLSYGAVHRVTGGDTVLVNPKFGHAFRARMDTKLLVMANCPPDMDVYNLHEASRMLYFLVDHDSNGADTSHLVVDKNGQIQLKGDPDFGERLLAEMPHFLARGAQDYMELCPTHGNIILPGTMVNDVSDRCASLEQERFEKFYADNFEYSAEHWIESHIVREVFDRLMPQGSRGNQQYSSFVKYIESKGHRKVRTGGDDDNRPRGYLYMRDIGGQAAQLLSQHRLHENHVGVAKKVNHGKISATTGAGGGGANHFGYTQSNGHTPTVAGMGGTGTEENTTQH